jgi:hypothetical protein
MELVQHEAPTLRQRVFVPYLERGSVDPAGVPVGGIIVHHAALGQPGGCVACPASCSIITIAEAAMIRRRTGQIGLFNQHLAVVLDVIPRQVHPVAVGKGAIGPRRVIKIGGPRAGRRVY